MSRVAWVLNLDADVELAQAGGYTPSRAVMVAMAPHVTRLAASLVDPDDLLIDEDTAPEAARGLAGRAFCPTPRAIALLERAGATPDPYPPLSVLREVNGRAFSAALGQTLPGAVFVHDLEHALAVLAEPPAIAPRWRVKRAFGMSGRGQRVLAPGPLAQTDIAFLRGGVRDGLQIEPNVTLLRELGLHGMLAQAGAAKLGRIVEQRCDARGQWLSSSLLSDFEHEAELVAEAERVATALHAAGYFGPFGIDAFEYEAGGERRLQPRSEINARYSMAFAIGMKR